MPVAVYPASGHNPLGQNPPDKISLDKISPGQNPLPQKLTYFVRNGTSSVLNNRCFVYDAMSIMSNLSSS